MIYLIGLNHKYQLEGYGTDWQISYNYLSIKSIELKVDLLAEEMNEEGISQGNAIDSVVRRVSYEQGLCHLFVDPDSLKRKCLGIMGFKEIANDLGYGPALRREESKKIEEIEKGHWDKRERYWLEKLKKCDFKKCILVIGSSHIQRFCILLDENGIRYEIIVEDYQG